MDKHKDRIKQIEEEYLKRLNQELSGLEKQREEGLEQLKGSAAAAMQEHHANANAISTQFERNRRSFNELAASRGLGTGIGTQAVLEQRSAYLKSFGNMQARHEAELSENHRAGIALREKYAELSREARDKNARHLIISQ